LKSKEVIELGLIDAKKRYVKSMEKMIKSGNHEDVDYTSFIEIQVKTLEWVLED